MERAHGENIWKLGETIPAVTLWLADGIWNHEDPILKPDASYLLCNLWKSLYPSESCFLKMSNSSLSSIPHYLFPHSLSQDKPCHETEAFLLPLLNEPARPTMAASSPDELGLM